MNEYEYAEQVFGSQNPFGTFPGYAGNAPQMQQAAVQVNPVEELFWICRRASLQGWKVRKERSQAGLQVVFVRQRGMVIDEVRGGLHMDWNCALTDACHAVECFLE